MKVVGYIAANGKSPFEKWFNNLDPQTAAKIVSVVSRLKQGNFSNTKSVGYGVIEYRLDWGPGRLWASKAFPILASSCATTVGSEDWTPYFACAPLTPT